MSNKPFPFSVCKECCTTGGGTDNEYINNNFANAVKKTIIPVCDKVVLEDVSPIAHIVKIRVASVYQTVEAVKVYITDDNGEVKEYIPNIDGTCDVISVAPKMTITAKGFRENDYINIMECEYNQDVNKQFSHIEEKLTELSTTKTAELVETISVGGIRQVTRTETPDGEPYNFKAVYVRYSTAMCTVKNLIKVTFQGGNSLIPTLCHYQFTNTVDQPGFISVHADVIGGMWQAISTAGVTQGSPTNVQMWGRNLVPYNGEKIEGIDILGTNTTFEDDAIIEIYGVRA